MLSHLIYVSDAPDVSQDDIDDILTSAREKNKALCVTGMLLYRDDEFLQILEGSRENINALYNRIVLDKRHSNTRILTFQSIRERAFASWSMGYMKVDEDTSSVALRYSDTEKLNYETITDEALLGYLKGVSRGWVPYS